MVSVLPVVRMVTYADERARTDLTRMSPRLDTDGRDAELALFQPIVELDSGAVAAYEALCRGPAGSPLEEPLALLAAARLEGRLATVDWSCRLCAAEAALEADLRPPLSLFLNVDAESLTSGPPPERRELWQRATQTLRLVVEVPEAALLERPAEILRTMTFVRERGWGVAVDGAGLDARATALLPLVRPDVVKVPVAVLRLRSTREQAAIAGILAAQSERGGTTIVATGVESAADLDVARTLGAELAQGHLLGRPGPLPLRAASRAARPISLLAASGAPDVPDSMMALLQRAQPARQAPKGMLLAVTRHLESQAQTLGVGAVVLSTFDAPRYFAGETRRRYQLLAKSAAFVAALGDSLGLEPDAGIRGGVLDPNDELRGEWCVVVVGQHFAAALASRDMGDDVPDLDRRFEFVLTYDHELVAAAASALMLRVSPVSVRSVAATAA